MTGQIRDAERTETENRRFQLSGNLRVPESMLDSIRVSSEERALRLINSLTRSNVNPSRLTGKRTRNYGRP